MNRVCCGAVNLSGMIHGEAVSATSAMLHNLSTLGISLRSMTDLLEQKSSL